MVIAALRPAGEAKVWMSIAVSCARPRPAPSDAHSASDKPARWTEGGAARARAYATAALPESQNRRGRRTSAGIAQDRKRALEVLGRLVHEAHALAAARMREAEHARVQRLAADRLLGRSHAARRGWAARTSRRPAQGARARPGERGSDACDRSRARSAPDSRPAKRSSSVISVTARLPRTTRVVKRLRSVGCRPCSVSIRRLGGACPNTSAMVLAVDVMAAELLHQPLARELGAATTITPLVSRSSRCTMPGRSGSPARTSRWKRSALTSVPSGWPGAGCTTRPAGFINTARCSSSNSSCERDVLRLGRRRGRWRRSTARARRPRRARPSAPRARHQHPPLPDERLQRRPRIPQRPRAEHPVEPLARLLRRDLSSIGAGSGTLTTSWSRCGPWSESRCRSRRGRRSSWRTGRR